MRVLTTANSQKIEYYDGLEVDTSNSDGTYKLSYNNSRRVCTFSPPAVGPTLSAGEWMPTPFFPALEQYTHVGDELVGGIMCQKYVSSERHGTTGTMDDHIAFYWDPVVGKPVRWHMHSRLKIKSSHTDEWIVNYVSFQKSAPAEADMVLPELCQTQPTVSDISIQLKDFFAAAHAMGAGAGEPSVGETDFDAFLVRYGKSYTAQERDLRRSIFEKNVRLVEELNQKHAGKTVFKGNQFLDMTTEEVLRFRGGKKRGGSRAERRKPEHLPFVYSHTPTTTATLPKNWDWRTAQPGAVGPVKDQGMCGSCWAYGLMGPVEAMHAIQTGVHVELPEQFVVDCTWTNSTDALKLNNGCDGGNSDVGALEIVRKYGGVIPSAKAYGSYLSVNGYCKDTRVMEVGAKLTGWVDIKERDEQGLLDALATKGPVNVNIMVPDEMVYYDSGVLNVASCKHNFTQIDHAVTAVGYGTDEHGTDYYIVRNSWSTYWGDVGYIKVARGELDCSISDQAGYPKLASTEESVIV